MNKYFKEIAKTLNIKYDSVNIIVDMLNEGSTVPFISRYRKEMTGGLDEVIIKNIEELNKKFEALEKRKITIIETIKEQNKLTDDLIRIITNTFSLSELEDIYLPYKPKRKTKASIAKEFGLEPLAKQIMSQQINNIELIANKYINNNIEDIDAALQGACDIIAEWINENQQVRRRIRLLFENSAIIYSSVIKNKEIEGNKYSDYFKYSELLKKCPSHRMLAIRRGESEKVLKIVIEPDKDKAINIIENIFIKAPSSSEEYIRKAIKDSYKRLIKPSLENEFKKIYKEKADNEAIDVFARNLRQLLLASPLGEKNILALDPGFKSGCKLVCLDNSGKLIHNETIYPHPPQNKTTQSKDIILNLINNYKIDAIAIGNGTAGRETEDFIKSINFDKDIQVFMVNESGASIYSASETAREEFPQYDITVRGTVSIGRRLMDPLSELVKIDAKSIGVGQYQHDVDQNKLKEKLDFVVESCVNSVGVNLNTASKHLLNYISGLSPKLSQNIIDYRDENGAFKSRKELKKVSRMGDKAFEQCAGFLRIKDSKNPLDNSAVHPESYNIVNKMATDMNCSISELINNSEIINKLDLKKYITQDVGLPTLEDIKKELEKPGRDPRTKIKTFEFAKGINSIDDLYENMILPGIVTNITNFGAFVDIGVHQDGLVHISQLANKYISNPADIVHLDQHVQVKVISIDNKRNRIQLSMKIE